ncbi:MAG: hypothetical protein EOL97_09810 [Spirochaetia bacterium]|nr:hypothetical protein [Spirochaetia bacterium]
MCEIKKPEISENQKMLANKLYKFLMQQIESVDKKTMCEFLGWEYNSSNDRKLRIILANIGKVKPLLATSDQRGYRLAKNSEDVEEVEHQWKEIDKRIQMLEERRKPLINFYEKYKA